MMSDHSFADAFRHTSHALPHTTPGLEMSQTNSQIERHMVDDTIPNGRKQNWNLPPQRSASRFQPRPSNFQIEPNMVNDTISNGRKQNWNLPPQRSASRFQPRPSNFQSSSTRQLNNAQLIQFLQQEPVDSAYARFGQNQLESSDSAFSSTQAPHGNQHIISYVNGSTQISLPPIDRENLQSLFGGTVLNDQDFTSLLNSTMHESFVQNSFDQSQISPPSGIANNPNYRQSRNSRSFQHRNNGRHNPSRGDLGNNQNFVGFIPNHSAINIEQNSSLGRSQNGTSFAQQYGNSQRWPSRASSSAPKNFVYTEPPRTNFNHNAKVFIPSASRVIENPMKADSCEIPSDLAPPPLLTNCRPDNAPNSAHSDFANLSYAPPPELKQQVRHVANSCLSQSMPDEPNSEKDPDFSRIEQGLLNLLSDGLTGTNTPVFKDELNSMAIEARTKGDSGYGASFSKQTQERSQHRVEPPITTLGESFNNVIPVTDFTKSYPRWSNGDVLVVGTRPKSPLLLEQFKSIWPAPPSSSQYSESTLTYGMAPTRDVKPHVFRNLLSINIDVTWKCAVVLTPWQCMNLVVLFDDEHADRLKLKALETECFEKNQDIAKYLEAPHLHFHDKLISEKLYFVIVRQLIVSDNEKNSNQIYWYDICDVSAYQDSKRLEVERQQKGWRFVNFWTEEGTLFRIFKKLLMESVQFLHTLKYNSHPGYLGSRLELSVCESSIRFYDAHAISQFEARRAFMISTDQLLLKTTTYEKAIKSFIRSQLQAFCATATDPNNEMKQALFKSQLAMISRNFARTIMSQEGLGAVFMDESVDLNCLLHNIWWSGFHTATEHDRQLRTRMRVVQ